MNNPIQLEIRKKISFWNKKINLNKNTFFKALGKVIIDGVANDWTKVYKHLIDLSSSFSIERKNEEKAYQLIFISLHKSCIEIIKNYQKIFEMISLPQKQFLRIDFDKKLNELELTIDKSFFNNPTQSLFLNSFQQLFEEWLNYNGFTETQAKNLSKEFPNYFVLALTYEWQNRTDYYLPIFQK